MSAPAVQVVDKVKGWTLQSVTLPTGWLNYYPIMPLGVSECINNSKQYGNQKKQNGFFVFSESLFL